MLYDTWLFVPATDNYLLKINDLIVDHIIFDLEDSIKDSDKRASLIRLCEIAKRIDCSHHFVRVNYGNLDEVQLLNQYKFRGYVIPKVDSKESIALYRPYLKDKQVIALVESVAGIVNIESITKDSLVFGIAFGGEDYCKELGVETNAIAMRYPRERVVLFSKYHHKYSIDTISMEYRNADIFSKQFQDAISMGFDAKLLIHPNQARVIHGLEKKMDLELMKSIIKQFESSPNGLIKVQGQWYEKPHIERLKKVIKQMEGNPHA